MQQTSIGTSKIPTKWNGSPCIAKRCMVVIADDTAYPTFLKNAVGTTRQVVKITVNGATFYIDNEDGTGWMKVTDAPLTNYHEVKAEKLICFLE